MYEQEIKVLKALANGINAFTGERCEKDSILNDADIVRTLYNVCDLLGNNFKQTKQDFVCPDDLVEQFGYEDSLSLTNIITKIAEMYPNLKKLKYKDLSAILIKKGILQQITGNDGKSRNVATDMAKNYGIFNAKKQFNGRVYESVTYNPYGQKFVLQVIKKIY